MSRRWGGRGEVPSPAAAPRRAGADTLAVLGELGYDAARIAELASRGIVAADAVRQTTVFPLIYQSICDRFDIGATAFAGNGSMSRSHSSHSARNSASRSG